MESVGVGVEQLLAVGELFKQLVLSGAYQLAVLNVTLGVGRGFLTRINLSVVSFIVKITFKVKSGTNAAVKPNVKSPCKKDLILGGKRNEIYP